ncbi:MAG: hypothetical protein Q7R78_00920 [bacterium]|nr:hypothetical protein [bacterium]
MKSSKPKPNKDKMSKEMFCFTLLFFILMAIPFYRIFQARKMRIDANLKLLRWRWLVAKDQRLLWKADHLLFFDFNNDEYQILWDKEIGAMEAYTLFYQKHYLADVSNSSWWDFIQERVQSEMDEFD